jgi:hypothetical protein
MTTKAKFEFHKKLNLCKNKAYFTGYLMSIQLKLNEIFEILVKFSQEKK